jgi:23S rRNA pseudouridine1911/1915/1917 synthase
MEHEFFQAANEHEGLRLDIFLAAQIEDASRSFIQKAIKDGCVCVNGKSCARASRKMAVGDRVEVDLPPAPEIVLEPEDIPLEILHEDEDVVVVNKPSGMVVHPAPGNYTGTLVSAILHHCPDFQRPGDSHLRPGVVHRLDKDTSGVMVVAKTVRAFNALARQAREHSFDRRYLALAQGEFRENRGKIDAAVGRSMVDRKRMTVTAHKSREAVTHFDVLERFGAASLLALTLETGRTHQIRVHLRFTGHPVLGDPVYGPADFGAWKVSDDLRDALNALHGQALHAERLGFVHPGTGESLTFTAPPPSDFQAALAAFRLGST